MAKTKTPTLKLHSIEEIEKRLPKNYRLHTHFADLGGPAEIVWAHTDYTTVQFKETRQVKIFGLFPWTICRWITIGETGRTQLGLTGNPLVTIFKEYSRHALVLAQTLKSSPFRVEVASA